MEIGAYVHWRRTLGNVTGVGRHIRGMVMGLSRVPGMKITIMSSRRELPPAGAAADHPANDTPLLALPKVALPFSRALLERIWWATNLPRAERYVPTADWIYSPADAYVPTRKALFASTIHDVEVFDDTLPWARRPGWERARRNWRLRLKPIFKHARLILTVSEFSKRQMVELLGVKAERIAVVGNGVEEVFFQAGRSNAADADAQQWRQQHGRYFIAVGGLSRRKGGDSLVALADDLEKSGSDIKILVSGMNDREFVDRVPLPPNVVSLGFVDDQRLPGLLKGSVALLFLSRYEGFGIPIVEAMASGTPVIVSNFASLPEVAGDAGIVVDVHQPEELAHVALQLARNEQTRREYIARGLERAAQFTWDACVARLIEAMRSAEST